ncbi:hypothetical protein HY497_00865 [Candidatus Woesearchaeota archaeon]|nr:hypothetical protein [Candidatus Woesearchaeota archaeon]
MPANRGLKFVREEGLKEIRRKYETKLELDLQECRGEDIPRKVYAARESIPKLRETGKTVFGITGQDFLDEYLSSKEYEQELRRRIEKCGDGYALRGQPLDLSRKGDYERAVFGLPALCLLGKGGMSLEAFVKAFPKDSKKSFEKSGYWERERIPLLQGKRIAIPQRYSNLIRRFLWRNYNEKGWPLWPGTRESDVGLIPLDGKVDVTAATDDTIDYAIDIVLTGKTCKENNIGIFEVLYRSDGVILSNR